MLYRESDFIKNMKKAQSIMIAHKNRKQKYVMKALLIGPSDKKKRQHSLVSNELMPER